LLIVAFIFDELIRLIALQNYELNQERSLGLIIDLEIMPQA